MDHFRDEPSLVKTKIKLENAGLVTFYNLQPGNSLLKKKKKKI